MVMSDGISDTIQDQKIGAKGYNILELEKIFLEKPSDEKAKELINTWKNFMSMRSGYWCSPPRHLSLERISLFTEFIDRKISVNEIREYIQQNENQEKFYTAVGGHGHIMGGSEERTILKALAKKYETIPHAFKLIIAENGQISPEKIDCKECSEGNFCSSTKECNCYNSEEYNKRRKRVEEARKLGY